MTTTPTDERPPADERTDAEEQPPQLRPRIDPRIRERRIEVIREAGRRRLRITLVIASTIVVIGMAYLTVRSPFLDVDRVRVTGTRRVSAADVERAAAVKQGAAMLFVNTGAIARRVERLPWVDHASVHRDYPGTLEIAVTEFAPKTFVRVSPTEVALVAANGRVVSLTNSAPTGATEIVGVHTVAKVGAPIVSADTANVMGRLPKRLAQQVRVIDMGGASAALVLNGTAGTTDKCAQQVGGVQGAQQIRFGTFASARSKGLDALGVLDDLAGRPFTYVDVSAESSPVSC